MAINAGTVYGELKLKIGKYEDAIKRAQGKMKSFSKGMAKAGSTLTKAVTVPIMGLGAAITKIAMDFDQSMAEVRAISGASGKQFELLESKAKEMGETTKFSASESAQALKYMAMAGWETEEMLSGIEGVMNLAAASGEDLAMVSDIVTDALTAFGMKASDSARFADLLASASSSSNTNVAMMGETFKYVAPLAGALGYTAEDTALAVGLMANAGIKGGQAGTVLRAALTRLQKPSGEAIELIDQLGIKTTDATGNMLPFRDLMVQLREKFGDMTEHQQAQAAATIFGQQAMSGMLSIINATEEDFDKLTEATRNYTGEAKRMADVMMDTTAGRLVVLKSKLEGLALQFADAIIPAVEKLIEIATKLVDWFANLSDKARENIVKFAALAAAIGPVLVVGSKLISAGTAIAGVFAKILPMLGGAKAAIAVLTGPVGWAVAAIAALVAGGIALYKNWDRLNEKYSALMDVLSITMPLVTIVRLIKNVQHAFAPAIEEVDLFGDGVSEATQKAVGAFMELNDGAEKSLKELAWSGKAVTAEMAEDIVGNIAGMKDQIVGKLSEQKQQVAEQYGKMFATAKGITEEEQQRILELTAGGYEERIAKVEKGNETIAEIMRRAAEEGRSITEAEANEINRIRYNMVEEGIKVLSDGEKEQLAIMERLKAESEKISALQAAEIVRNSKEKTDGVIAEAEREYEQALMYAAELRAQGGAEAEVLADKVVAEAERQRDEAVSSAEDMHNRIVEEAQAQAGEHARLVDWETGEVKSNWRVMVDDVKTWATDLKSSVSQRWEEMKQSASTKWGEIKDSVSSKADDLKRSLAGKWDDIKRGASEKWEGILRWFRGLKFPEFKLPHIKLPHFSLTGSFSLSPPRVPRLSVSWYGKGAIFKRPSLIGVGEAGAEAVLPIEKLTDIFASTMREVLPTASWQGLQPASIVIESMSVREEADIEKIAYRLHELQNNYRRSGR